MMSSGRHLHVTNTASIDGPVAATIIFWCCAYRPDTFGHAAQWLDKQKPGLYGMQAAALFSLTFCALTTET